MAGRFHEESHFLHIERSVNLHPPPHPAHMAVYASLMYSMHVHRYSVCQGESSAWKCSKPCECNMHSIAPITPWIN